ncbi:MAG: TatD family hydrolase [Chitinophagaceae bacterium]|nr:TatD family hydrolase [Chitinophagaceae bacterium]
MVLETDAPYLAPVPFRAKEMSLPEIYCGETGRNKRVDLEEIGIITTANAEKLFNL